MTLPRPLPAVRRRFCMLPYQVPRLMAPIYVETSTAAAADTLLITALLIGHPRTSPG